MQLPLPSQKSNMKTSTFVIQKSRCDDSTLGSLLSSVILHTTLPYSNAQALKTVYMTQWKRLSKMGISRVSQELDVRKGRLFLIPNLAFVKLLQCASKFGDDLNISANKDLVSGIHLCEGGERD